ncbi:MAG: SprT-like domain-containing protein [Candidatus Woesearchaeota archaeon]|nr:SprT-like domain-containing protein [Candidatus Woesearchaeota archaeon]
MDSALAIQAYEELYGKTPLRKMEVKYHGGLKGYNATVQQTMTTTTFRLSKRFKDCEDEIKIGVIQFLFTKLKKTKQTTDNIELYHSFLKNMSDFAPVTDIDPILEESFERMNERYFKGMLNKPNLVWGRKNKRLMGTYEYGTDTITISRVLQDAGEMLLDCVMYHEMLHKKHKFSCSGGRTHSHTPAFKKDEAKFYDKHAEEKLGRFLAGKKTMKKRKSSFLDRVMGWT